MSTALSPKLTAEEWEEAERILEKAENELQGMYDAMAGRKLTLADVERLVSKQDSEEPPGETSGWVVMMLGIIEIMAKIRESEAAKQEWNGWATLLLYCCAGIIGPETSMQILYNQFGRAVLRQSLNTLRGPTSVRGQDHRRIRIYIDAITWATGCRVRHACRLLAPRGLKEQKDGAQGRVWVDLNNCNTIRKRYMDARLNEYYKKDILATKIYERDLLRLKVMWHRSGEPPFLNWLKQTISREQGTQ